MIAHKTIITPGTAETEEKKSRFIGYTCHCETEEEALNFINGIKKKHFDARHNCYAYIIGEKGEIMRASDDGEPQKTAGQPILSALTSADLKNVCLVVTRYFGGTLLGTGGLVRAYGLTAEEALKASKIVRITPGHILKVTVNYSDIKKIEYVFSSAGITVSDTEYAEKVVFTLKIPDEKIDDIVLKITEITAGKAEITKCEEIGIEG